MGNCCGLCAPPSEESTSLHSAPPDSAERRRRAAEAADRRERESDSRGLRDPQAFKAKLAQREELERREAEATQSGGGQLKWQVQ